MAGGLDRRRGIRRALDLAGRSHTHRPRVGDQRTGYARAVAHQRGSRPVSLAARLLAALLTLLLMALLFGALIASSECGLFWAYRIAVQLAPGQLSIEGLHGRLLGPLLLCGVFFLFGVFCFVFGCLVFVWCLCVFL